MEPVEERNSEAGGEARSFYVAGVPPVVFNADPETSIRVSQCLESTARERQNIILIYNILYVYSPPVYCSQSSRVYLEVTERR